MPYAPTETERTWAEAFADAAAASVCLQLAAGVNRKDPLLIIDTLDEECTYESQSNYYRLRGKSEIGAFFATVIENVRQAGESREVKAELAADPHAGGPCVLLHQRDSPWGSPGLGRPDGYWTVQHLEGGKVRSLFKVTLVPNPYGCRRSGLFPGLAAEEVRRAIEFRGPRLPRSEEASLVLFKLGMPGVTADAAMMEALREVHGEFAPAKVLFCTMEDRELVARYRIVSYPTLAVVYGGEPVLILEGLRSAEELRESLRGIFE